MYALTIYVPKEPWNKNKLIGQKLPLKLQQIWSIRIRLELSNKTRDLALFNLAIDSKLRGCDLVALRVRDICHGNIIQSRAIVVQKKTQQPVQFEITVNTRKSISELIATQSLSPNNYWFKSRPSLQTIFLRGNMAELLIIGLIQLVWTKLNMARIRCGEQSHH
jgi:hypothetical protein